MRKALLQSDVIARFENAHGHQYDYSNVDYINARAKVNIICKIHGSFWQSVFDHIAGRGCQKCGDELRKKTCLEIYGVENVSQVAEIVKKKIQTGIQNGTRTDPNIKDDWIRYQELVQQATDKSYKTYLNEINPQNLIRGEKYHLDHIFSKLDGFKNDISPTIIGHHTNLQILTKMENLQKKTRSDKTKDELYEDYSSSGKNGLPSSSNRNARIIRVIPIPPPTLGKKS